MNPKTIGKVILSILLIGLAVGIVSIGIVSIYVSTYFGGLGCCYYDQTIISNESELVEFITNKAKSSTSLNIFHIIIFVIIPWILLSIVLILWKKQFNRFLLLPSVVILIMLLSVAVFMYKFQVDMVDMQLEEQLSIWFYHFDIVKQYGLEEFKLIDDNNFNNGHRGMFTTLDYDINYNPSSSLVYTRFCLSNCPKIPDYIEEEELIALLFAREEGLFDAIPIRQRHEAEITFPNYMRDNHKDILASIRDQGLTDETRDDLKKVFETIKKSYK